MRNFFLFLFLVTSICGINGCSSDTSAELAIPPDLPVTCYESILARHIPASEMQTAGLDSQMTQMEASIRQDARSYRFYASASPIAWYQMGADGPLPIVNERKVPKTTILQRPDSSVEGLLVQVIQRADTLFLTQVSDGNATGKTARFFQKPVKMAGWEFAFPGNPTDRGNTDQEFLLRIYSFAEWQELFAEELDFYWGSPTLLNLSMCNPSPILSRQYLEDVVDFWTERELSRAIENEQKVLLEIEQSMDSVRAELKKAENELKLSLQKNGTDSLRKYMGVFTEKEKAFSLLMERRSHALINKAGITSQYRIIQQPTLKNPSK